MNGGFRVLDADVDVEPEDEVRPGNHLHVFNDGVVSSVGIDILRAPIGEGMGGGGGEAKVVLVGQMDEVGAEQFDFQSGFLDVAADGGAHFDH